MNSDNRIDISVVIPVYTEVESLREICDQFETHVLPGIHYEIVFVNDGNLNNRVWTELKTISKRKSVRVIHLSRNFGQHTAIAAGLKNSRGAYVIVMDADLQYLPKDCLRMVDKAREDNLGAVLSIIPDGKHSRFKGVTSRAFYWIMRKLGVPQRSNMGSTFVVSRHVAQGLCRMGDRYRHTIPMVLWLCGEIAYLEIPHYPRRFGASGYSMKKLVSHAITGITSFSAQPLYISLILAFVFAFISLSAIGVLLVSIFLFHKNYLAGWSSTIVTVLFCSATILTCVGIMGLYLARVFEFTKGRPLYYVQGESSGEALLFEDQD
jgi:dolichol-phosphate mannosyltransferase